MTKIKGAMIRERDEATAVIAWLQIGPAPVGALFHGSGRRKGMAVIRARRLMEPARRSIIYIRTYAIA
jgi:hypothetical protein